MAYLVPVFKNTKNVKMLVFLNYSCIFNLVFYVFSVFFKTK